jgi:hypothetical protein
MGLIRPAITDAHARRVPLVKYEFLIPGFSEATRRARLIKAGYTIAGPPAKSRQAVMLYVAISILAVLIGLSSILLLIVLDLPMWYGLALILWLAISSQAVVAICTRRFAPRHFADVYPRAGYCASCGYDLTKASTDTQEVTTCPECGSSWRRGLASMR